MNRSSQRGDHKLCVSISDQQWEELKVLAVYRRMTVSCLIRDQIEQLLEKEKEEANR